MKLFFFLKPESLERIVICAAQDIPAGTYLPIFAAKDYRLMRKKTLANMPMSEVFASYCVLDSSGVHAPSNFNRMSIGWYITHSDNPTALHRNYRYYAARDIKAGEVITVDFKTL